MAETGENSDGNGAGGDADRFEQLRDEAISFAEGLIEASGLEMTLAIDDEEPEGITLAFEGADSKFLVGRGGQALDALQYIAMLSVNKRGGPRLRILCDADDYRLRRENTLKKLASDLADHVRSTGQEAVLDPLSPMERRIVHRALMDEPGIRTYSEGEEPERYIVIAPAA